MISVCPCGDPWGTRVDREFCSSINLHRNLLVRVFENIIWTIVLDALKGQRVGRLLSGPIRRRPILPRLLQLEIRRLYYYYYYYIIIYYLIIIIILLYYYYYYYHYHAGPLQSLQRGQAPRSPRPEVISV